MATIISILKFFIMIYCALRGPTPECCSTLGNIGGPDDPAPSIWAALLKKAGLVEVRVLYIIFETYVQQTI